MSTRLPVLFVSHGSPLHAVEPSAAATAWQAEAARLPRPSAILVVSAHWETEVPQVSAARLPATMHDFGGFPDALYRIRYAAPGAPEQAERVLALLREAGFAAGADAERALDHGVWVPLLRMYPAADIPVLELSVQPGRDAHYHLQLGAALAPLRDEGVLIIGSGHMTHNLRDYMLSWRGVAAGDYSQRFRDWVAERLRTGNNAELAAWQTQAPQALRAHPSVEHFLPLLVAQGAGAGGPATCLFDGTENGVLAMDAWRWD